MTDLVDVQRILVDILNERFAQDKMWGEQNHPDLHPTLHEAYEASHRREAAVWKAVNAERVAEGTLAWDGILLEEAHEAAEEPNPEKKIEELVQVAAVAVAWIEAIRRRQAAKEPVQLALFEEPIQ